MVNEGVGGVGHAGVGWGGSWGGVGHEGVGGVGHAGVGWGVGHAGVGWGGSCRGGVGWVMKEWVGWVMQGTI